jgi:hypothetical protein
MCSTVWVRWSRQEGSWTGRRREQMHTVGCQLSKPCLSCGLLPRCQPCLKLCALCSCLTSCLAALSSPSSTKLLELGCGCCSICCCSHARRCGQQVVWWCVAKPLKTISKRLTCCSQYAWWVTATRQQQDSGVRVFIMLMCVCVCVTFTCVMCYLCDVCVQVM